MKTQFRSISELAQAVEFAAAQNVDIVYDTRELRMASDMKGQSLLVLPATQSHGLPLGEVVMNHHSERQLATWAKIPAKYYERMRVEAPDLLAVNANHWLHESPARRMLRMTASDPALTGGHAATMRAWLSDTYRRIDHELILRGALEGLEPLAEQAGGIQLRELALTDRRMSLKVSFPKVEGEVKVGDVVQSGVWISNSEIGDGAVSVSPFIYRLICLNGMTTTDGSVKRRHVGRRVQADDEGQIRFTDETVAADDRAISLKVRDTVASLATTDSFQALLGKMQDAATGPSIENPIRAAEILGKTVGLAETERDAFMEQLIKGQDYSRWGAVNAVTALANDVEDMSRAQDLQSLGGTVLDLPPGDWTRIATAA